MKGHIKDLLAGLLTATVTAITIAIIPILAALVGYWIGFAAEKLIGGLLILQNLPSVTATAFYGLAALILVVKAQLLSGERK